MMEAPWQRRLRLSWPSVPHDPLSPPHPWKCEFVDDRGSEVGHWFVTADGDSERRLAAPDLPPAYNTGIAIGTDFAIIGAATDQGYFVHLVRPEGSARLLHHHRERVEVGQLSRDETLVSLIHSEHGDWYHPALRILDLQGTTVAELWDGPGWGLWAGAWSPVSGDQRLIIRHERSGMLRPALWVPQTDQLVELPLELPGEVDATWYPDASALLLTHEQRGRIELFRLDLASGGLTRIPTEPGTIWATGVLPDGELWYLWDSAARPPELHVGTQTTRRATDDPALAGRAYTDVDVDGIHTFLVEPPAPRPHPTVFLARCAPSFIIPPNRDTFSPVVQSWVDHGFAVVLVNYRGCRGYGKAWRDAVLGNPGLTELADIATVHDWVIARGIADPARIVLGGESWGGYLTLLGLGIQPERWALGIARVPVGDFIACYEETVEPLKAWDRALFGGSPEAVPDVYQKASPITYAEQVRAPLLILAGEHDARCPLRQIENYVARLRDLAKPHELYRFDGGHFREDDKEWIRQIARQLAFAARYLGTEPPSLT